MERQYFVHLCPPGTGLGRVAQMLGCETAQDVVEATATPSTDPNEVTVGEKIIAALQGFSAALESGKPLSERFACHTLATHSPGRQGPQPE